MSLPQNRAANRERKASKIFGTTRVVRKASARRDVTKQNRPTAYRLGRHANETLTSLARRYAFGDEEAGYVLQDAMIERNIVVVPTGRSRSTKLTVRGPSAFPGEPIPYEVLGTRWPSPTNMNEIIVPVQEMIVRGKEDLGRRWFILQRDVFRVMLRSNVLKSNIAFKRLRWMTQPTGVSWKVFLDARKEKPSKLHAGKVGLFWIKKPYATPRTIGIGRREFVYETTEVARSIPSRS